MPSALMPETFNSNQLCATGLRSKAALVAVTAEGLKFLEVSNIVKNRGSCIPYLRNSPRKQSYKWCSVFKAILWEIEHTYLYAFTIFFLYYLKNLPV